MLICRARCIHKNTAARDVYKSFIEMSRTHGPFTYIPSSPAATKCCNCVETKSPCVCMLHVYTYTVMCMYIHMHMCVNKYISVCHPELTFVMRAARTSRTYILNVTYAIVMVYHVTFIIVLLQYRTAICSKHLIPPCALK